MGRYAPELSYAVRASIVQHVLQGTIAVVEDCMRMRLYMWITLQIVAVLYIIIRNFNNSLITTFR